MSGLDTRERESIRLDLQSEDEEIRRLAVERLGALSADESTAELIACLGDSSWRVRKAAVERLASLPEPWTLVDPLLCAIADGDNPGRRNAAVDVLIRCGSRAVPRLIEATATEDADVRKQVVDALAGIADERATDCLIRILGDPDPNVRAAAADALGGIDDPRCGEMLVDLVVRPGEERLVQFSALRALGRLDQEVEAQRLSPILDDPVLRPAAFALLGSSDDEQSIEVLVKGLGCGSRASREAAMGALLRALGRLDGVRAGWLIERVVDAATNVEGLVESAIERLETGDLAARLVLVQFLGLLRREDVVAPILRAAHDEALAEVSVSTLTAMGSTAERGVDAAWHALDSETRQIACELLGATRGELGAQRLLGALDDSDARLRSAAARALGRRRCAAGLPALVRRLRAAAGAEDPTGEDELAAVTEALVSLGRSDAGAEPGTTEQALALLTEGLDGTSESVRLAIATVLGRIGRPQDEGVVVFLLKDPSASVRRAAVQALGRLETGKTSEPLRLALADESPYVRIAAAHALGSSTQARVIEDLERLADDEDARVRAATMRAIGHHAATVASPDTHGRVVGLLSRALADEGIVAVASVESLNELGGRDAARASRVLLSSDQPELVLGAVGCVARHGDPELVEELVPLVSHAHWSVRAEAIQTLSERGITRAVPAVLRRLELEQDDFVRDAILRALKRAEG